MNKKELIEFIYNYKENTLYKDVKDLEWNKIFEECTDEEKKYIIIMTFAKGYYRFIEDIILFKYIPEEKIIKKIIELSNDEDTLVEIYKYNKSYILRNKKLLYRFINSSIKDIVIEDYLNLNNIKMDFEDIVLVLRNYKEENDLKELMLNFHKENVIDITNSYLDIITSLYDDNNQYELILEELVKYMNEEFFTLFDKKYELPKSCNKEEPMSLLIFITEKILESKREYDIDKLDKYKMILKDTTNYIIEISRKGK